MTIKDDHLGDESLDDYFLLGIKTITHHYFEVTLLEYLRKTDYYVDEQYLEINCPDYMKLKKDKK